MRINKTGITGGGILATIHFLAVAYFYWSIVYGNNSDAVYGWLLLIFVDYPVSMGMGIRSLQIEGDYIWNNGTLPGLYFGIIGTAWWFILGYFITWMTGGAAKAIKRKFRGANLAGIHRRKANHP